MKPEDEDEKLPERMPSLPTTFDGDIGRLQQQLNEQGKQLEKLQAARRKALLGKRKALVRAYLRKSSTSDNKQVNSIQVQKGLIDAYVARKGLCRPEDIQWYRDKQSASHFQLEQRVAGRQLMHDLMPGEHIVVVRWDRAFRTIQDGLSVIERWQDQGVNFHMLDFNGWEIDLSIPTHKFIITVMAGVSQLECELKGQRGRETFDHLRQAQPTRRLGGYGAPVGWKYIKRQLRKGIAGSTSTKVRNAWFLVEDPDERETCRWIREDLHQKQGMSLRQILTYLWSMHAKASGDAKKKYVRGDGKPWSTKSIAIAIAGDFSRPAGAVGSTAASGSLPPSAQPHSPGQSTTGTTAAHPTTPAGA